MCLSNYFFSNTSSFHNPITKRIVRVQHSKPYKAQRRIQCSDSIHMNERPKWGVNQPSKSYVRMTERDPHFTKRKKLQEIRKQHWARELAKANQLSRRSTVASYPSLRAHKAASSSDCTVGYSSSEFETRYLFLSFLSLISDMFTHCSNKNIFPFHIMLPDALFPRDSFQI